MSKKLMWQIILIISVCTVFIWVLNNPAVVSYLFLKLMSVAAPLLLGGSIAFIINIPMKKLEGLFDKIFSKFKKTMPHKLKRGISLVVSTIFIIGVVISLIVFIVPQVAKTVTSFLEVLPGYLQTFETHIKELSVYLSTLDITLPDLDINTDKILSAFDFVSQKGQVVLDNTISVTTSVFSSVFNFFLAFTFSMYLLLSKEKVLKRAKIAVYALMSKKWADFVSNIMRRTERAFSNFITGQLMEAIILGTLCYIGMRIFRFPQPGLISIIVAFTAIIPVFGAWIGAASGAFIVLLTNPMATLWFLLFLIILQQFETNIIYPKVVGKSVGLPGLLVLASVTVGGNLLGVAGMLIAVPVCSVIYSVFAEITDHYYNKKYQTKKCE